MDLRIMTEPQFGATYADQLAAARRAEECGFGAYFRSDHFLTMGGDGLPGPTDAWVTLAGLARETSTIRLGTLVSSATFRLPGVLAVTAAQVDVMSGGRVELGLGTGWFEAEHQAYGIPFPELAERFDRLEEQLEVITGLWSAPAGERFSFSGKHYTVQDSPALPKPAQQSVPIIVGGTGPRRTPRIAARFATEYNTAFPTPEEAATRFAAVREACAAAGRAEPPVLSAMLPMAVAKDEAALARRVQALGGDLENLREHGFVGTPAEAVDRAGRYAEAGAERLYLQLLDLADLDHLDLVAGEVMPQL